MSVDKPKYAMLFTPILSMCILTIGNTFYTTYTTLELERMGQSNFIVGLISAAYFTGMVLGSYFSQKLILRIGYIRAYVLFATLMGLGAISQGIFYDVPIWGISRFICGYALAGLFIVVEAWCLEGAGKSHKGLVLSIYLFIYYFVQASGQFLLNIPFNSVLMTFCVISILASISIIPVCLTRFEMPKQEHPNLLSPVILYKKAPLGMWTALVAGMILGSIYTIYPLFLKQAKIPIESISYLMFAIILGGMLLQLPIGKISDLVDRRIVLVSMLIGSVFISILICIFHNNFWQLAIFSFILGGLTFTFYPLSISYSSDYLSADQLIGIVGILALSYGMGSMIGPLGVTWLMSLFGPFGFFIYVGFVCLLLMTYTLWRIRVRQAPNNNEKVAFQSMAAETSVAIEVVYEQQLMEEKEAPAHKQ
ncbi:MFS transporter [Fastidiosibacter lacustris]|uniref:MFS transporter n=1 Tax=Fastidiosibacter lacustris TaxID=2056695 RepID=UPI000E34EB2C|nr:MFS transporter [Fastidiosibacter lacustris]